MKKEKILKIVLEVVNKCGNDTDKAANVLMLMAEERPELMLEFINHGIDVIKAIAEGQLETKH